jgi:hypothetical protein
MTAITLQLPSAVRWRGARVRTAFVATLMFAAVH